MSGPHSPTTNIPPYTSKNVVDEFLEWLRTNGIPERIERRELPFASDAIRTQLMTSIRGLYLVDADNVPQPNLRRLVEGNPAERQQAWRDALTTAYPYLLEDTADGFDLRTGTTEEFDRRFRAAGAQGETARKCETLFLKLAEEAGIRVSPAIRPVRSPDKYRRNHYGDRRNGTSESRTAAIQELFAITDTAGEDTNEDTTPDEPTVPEETSQPVEARMFTPEAPPTPPARVVENRKHRLSTQARQAYLAKVPDFNPAWSQEERANWLAGYFAVIDFLNQFEETENDGVGL